jgi:hypothetical protein
LLSAIFMLSNWALKPETFKPLILLALLNAPGFTLYATYLMRRSGR